MLSYGFPVDPAKNEQNLQKHGFDFMDAAECFQHSLLVHEDTRQDYGERRWTALGRIQDTLVNCMFTRRGMRIRIISLRRANRREREIYHHFLATVQSHELDTDSSDDRHGH